MRRRQATARWELERALRRAALRRGVAIGAGGVLLVLVGWLFLVMLFLGGGS